MENNNKDIRQLMAMLQYIDEIENIESRKPMDNILGDYDVELSAILMKLSQIGELVGRLSLNIIDDYPDVPWRKIKNLRNVIAHDYESIKLDIIKDVLMKFLPELKQQLPMIIDRETKRTRFEYGN